MAEPETTPLSGFAELVAENARLREELALAYRTINNTMQPLLAGNSTVPGPILTSSGTQMGGGYLTALLAEVADLRRRVQELEAKNG